MAMEIFIVVDNFFRVAVDFFRVAGSIFKCIPNKENNSGNNKYSESGSL